MMSQIKAKDTDPEIKVRSTLHALGYRFRLHRKDLPGSPDIVLPRFKLALFVHGCYWHRHKDCPLATTPSTNREFWMRKFQANVQRDRKAISSLKSDGWQVGVIWECETKDPDKLEMKLIEMLKDNS